MERTKQPKSEYVHKRDILHDLLHFLHNLLAIVILYRVTGAIRVYLLENEDNKISNSTILY